MAAPTVIGEGETMPHASLAEQFNVASEELAAQGHRVLVRRARALLEAGDSEGALDFLDDAAGRLGSTRLLGLAEGLRGWHDSGGQTAALVSDPTWMEGEAREQRFARLVSQAASGGLSALADVLAAQQRALAGGEALPAEPAARLAPDQMPPLPGKEAERQPGSAIANIFPDARRAKAVVEAPSNLTARPLDLDGAPAAPAPITANEVSAPPAPMATIEPLLPDLSLDKSAPKGPIVAAAESPDLEPMPDLEAPPVEPVAPAGALAAPLPGHGAGFDNLPELHAPPSLPVPQTPSTGAGTGSTVILLAILAAVVAVAAWYFLK